MADPFDEAAEGLGNLLGILLAAALGLLAIGLFFHYLGIALQAIVGFLLQPDVLVFIIVCVAAIVARKLYTAYDQGPGKSKRLYQQALHFSAPIIAAHEDPHEALTQQLANYLQFAPSPTLISVAHELYDQENFSFDPPPDTHDLVEHAAYRDAVRHKMQALSPPGIHDDFTHVIANALAFFRLSVPTSGQGPFTVPAIDLLTDVPEQVRNMLASVCAMQERGLFLPLHRKLSDNLVRLAERHFSRAAVEAGKFLYPLDHPGTPQQIVDDYLQGTSLHRLFSEPISFGFPHETRFEHTHIVAGTGHGKTQTLQTLILSDLCSNPSMVIIDSQGQMLEKIARLKIFEGRNDLIIIDPTDLEHPPSLNMFDTSHLAHYSPKERERMLYSIIELYEYVFASLLRAELTQKQNVLFRYALRLVLSVPNTTIVDLVKILDDPAPYLPYVDRLPETAQQFFQTEFFDKSFAQTKQQIRRRLYGILENDTFRRMFAAPHNRLNMSEALNSGKVVLVNTAKDHLTQDASSLLGRYFIALTLQAAVERTIHPESQRHPTFLYVDESAEYFDDNIDTLLNTARKSKLGLILAHQYLDQTTQTLRSSLFANTSIKLAGGTSEKDARALAPEMRTTADFITNLHKRDHQFAEMACYVRNFTPHAIKLTIPFGTLEHQPQMSQAAFQDLLRRNRRHLSEDQPTVNLHRPDLPWKREEANYSPPDPHDRTSSRPQAHDHHSSDDSRDWRS